MLEGIGALMSGAALLGGSFGLGSSGDGRGLAKRATQQNMEIQKDAWKVAKFLSMNELPHRIYQAKQAGIHPLAVMGMPSGGSPSVPSVSADYYGGTDDRFLQAAQGIDALTRGAARLRKKPDADAVETLRLEKKLLEARIRSENALATKYLSDAAILAQPGFTGGRPSPPPMSPGSPYTPDEDLITPAGAGIPESGPVNAPDLEQTASNYAHRLMRDFRNVREKRSLAKMYRKAYPERARQGRLLKRQRDVKRYRKALKGLPRGVGY